MNIRYQIRKIIMGLLLRCPNCEQGKISDALLRVLPTCPVCGVRFERREGESVGGMLINLCVVEMIAIAGFFSFEVFTDISIPLNGLIWVTFSALGPILFYRHARGAWIAVAYLNGDVKSDENSEPTS